MKSIFLESAILFRPSVLKRAVDPKTQRNPLNAAPVLPEGRLISDLTMPARDWAQFDEPACWRFKSRPYEAPEPRLSILLLKQAS